MAFNFKYIWELFSIKRVEKIIFFKNWHIQEFSDQNYIYLAKKQGAEAEASSVQSKTTSVPPITVENTANSSTAPTAEPLIEGEASQSDNQEANQSDNQEPNQSDNQEANSGEPSEDPNPDE